MIPRLVTIPPDREPPQADARLGAAWETAKTAKHRAPAQIQWPAASDPYLATIVGGLRPANQPDGLPSLTEHCARDATRGGSLARSGVQRRGGRIAPGC